VASVRTHIEREYSDAWVEGEISNFRAQNSGHLYFTLKDQGAQISVVVFRSSARLLRFRPADGMQVVVRGRVTIYEDRGQLQIIAEYVEPKGAGALQIAFEQLKAKLQAEGLFDAARKKAIPALPRRIGIVTSPQAAAVRDILNILRRRHHTVSVLIFPAQVQGEAAAGEVGAGVRYFNRARNVDVIIVARGGGSAEDLAAEIYDAARYTFVFDLQDYTDGTWLVHRRLKAQGFDLEARRNRWESPEYKGIRTRWRDPAHDLIFEVQFHTQDSWEVLATTHEAYLRITDPQTPVAERARLRSRQVAAAAACRPPARCAEIADFRADAR